MLKYLEICDANVDTLTASLNKVKQGDGNYIKHENRVPPDVFCGVKNENTTGYSRILSRQA